ncbi:MAG: ComF family protein [Patescibacteria group bacterium]|nr:ComF family protein [Patescibacteria group bacterium]
MDINGLNIPVYPKQIASFFLEIFFPKRCVNCGKIALHFVCPVCVQNIEKVKTSTCPVCGKISQFGKFCPNCKKAELGGIITAARYEIGPIKEMVHHLKYSGMTSLAEMLGELIVERLEREMPRGNIVVVPVPLHRKREFSRGFNQAELIARYISKRLNISGGMALSRVKNTESQVKLSGDLRKKNLIDAFACTDEELILGKTVLLVDDVTTTGSTLIECAKILKQNGAKKVFGVVVARRVN